MAGVSLAFALVTALKVPLAAAVPLACCWSIAILSLDRLFVVSMSRKGSTLAQLGRAVPRVLLALLLGFVISTPFVLQIFQPEIEHEITVLHAQAQQAYLQSQAASQLTQDVSKDTQLVDTLSAEAGGSGTSPAPPQDAQIKVLDGQLTQAETQQQDAQAQESADSTTWSCQLYGTAPDSTCSGFKNVGPGPLADAAKTAYMDAKNDDQRASATVQQLRGQIDTLQKQAAQSIAQTQASNEAAAKAQLPQARADLAAAQANEAAQNAKFTTENSNNSGLLIRLQALDAITAGNSTLEAARWLLFILFVAIDCMPVMVKVMLNLGPESNYDRMLAAEEKKQLRVAASNRAVRAAAEKLAADTVLGEARSRLEGWQTPIPEVTQDIVEARRRVEARRVKAWENYQALHPFNRAAGVPGSFAPANEAPFGFIAWPWVTGATPPPPWRPVRAVRNMWGHIRQVAAARWRKLRFRRPAQGGPAPGKRAYGAPFSPRMMNSANGSGRAASHNAP